MKTLRSILMLGLIAAATACAPPRQAPPPAAEPKPPAPLPPRPQLPPPPPPQADWRDIPLTPGRWSFQSEAQISFALFGAAEGEPSFIVRCDRTSRQVRLSRQGLAAGGAMTIRTSYSARSFPVSAQVQATPFVSISMPASDSFLDGIAFSRGRFTVEVPGLPMLVIPAWAEPARVIEDCRG